MTGTARCIRFDIDMRHRLVLCVTALALTDNGLVIDLVHRREHVGAVAAATFHGGANMVHVLAHGINAVMAGDAVFSHVAMTEMRRLPTEG